MRNLKALVLISLMSVVSVAAQAEDKIAVIDIQRALFTSDYAQSRVKESLETADFVALKAKAEGSAADLKAMSEEEKPKE